MNKANDKYLISPVMQSYVIMHISVVLWSFTAILGDLISLSATYLVWWRVALTSMMLLFVPRVISGFFQLEKGLLFKYGLIGVIIGIHWICFYGAIKLANASVCLVAMSTASLFTAFIEPYVTRSPISKVDLICGILIIPGMLLTVNSLTFDMLIGFGVGLISAFLAAAFAVYNKQLVTRAPAKVIVFVEITAAWLFITLLLPILLYRFEEVTFMPVTSDWWYLILLAALCTVVPYLLHIKAFKHLTAFASNLVINLEPVYGILLAIIILQDHKELNRTFYIGVFMILIVVMIYPVIKKRAKGRA